MSDGTIAVPLSLIEHFPTGQQRALCPSCVNGRLHPYAVEVDLGGFRGYRYGTGWVAVCVGSAKEDPHFAEESSPPCGFSMQLEAHR